MKTILITILILITYSGFSQTLPIGNEIGAVPSLKVGSNSGYQPIEGSSGYVIIYEYRGVFKAVYLLNEIKEIVSGRYIISNSEKWNKYLAENNFQHWLSNRIQSRCYKNNNSLIIVFW